VQSPGNPDPAGPPNASAEEDGSSRRTYLVGAGFGMYGVAMIAYGTWRTRSVDVALRAGKFAVTPDRLLAALTAAGIVLGLLTVALVIAD
jgi:hypothetical protein